MLLDTIDRLAIPEITLRGKTISMFHLCGGVGLFLAVLLTLTITNGQGLSLSVMLMLIGVAVVSFFMLTMLRKIITGHEQLIYYHHEIAILILAAGVLWFLNLSVTRYLDILILGVGVFLMCGRLGCFTVGCCHGRPNRFGVCYRAQHAQLGFTPYYTGIRLFPVQLLESLWVLSIVAVGIYISMEVQLSGAVLTWYIISYDTGRFCFEFIRGDPDRAYVAGFSEGQWISVLLMLVTVAVEQSGGLPSQIWHLYLTSVIVMVMIILTAMRYRRVAITRRLRNPRHIKELVGLIQGKIHQNTANPVSTSLGIQVSGGVVSANQKTVHHYTLSSVDGGMTEEIAKSVANLILQLKHPTQGNTILKGAPGIFHILVDSKPM